MKRKQSKMTQPLSHNFPAIAVAPGFRVYSGHEKMWAMLVTYLQLFKLRSAVLNLLSALVGMFLAAGPDIPAGTAFFLLVSGLLAAAGCGALNSYIDRDLDRIMYRTSLRPLPMGKIKSARRALYAGVFMVIAGLIISALRVNLVTALFIASGSVIYIFAYTIWLKRRTPWSVAVGGLAGVCALLAGWAAVSTQFNLSLLLFSVFVYLWTHAHFWGLAIKNKNESQRAKIPTLPVVYGVKTASRWAALSGMFLLPLSIIPYSMGILDGVYVIVTLTIGIIVLAANIKLYFSPTAQNAWLVFRLSSPYLAGIYLAVIIDILGAHA
ncbi:MAG: heme o synthase [Dehalococcoidales bacterium]|nr:heme o synthase [Dehalococcoidales bacterium]